MVIKNAKKFTALALAVSFSGAIGVGKAMNPAKPTGVSTDTKKKNIVDEIVDEIEYSTRELLMQSPEDTEEYKGIQEKFKESSRKTALNARKKALEKVDNYYSPESPKNVRELTEEEKKEFNQGVKSSKEQINYLLNEYVRTINMLGQ